MFRSAVYHNPNASIPYDEEVYHGFLYRGRWYADVTGLQKEFRHDPKMFKVQIQRRVAR